MLPVQNPLDAYYSYLGRLRFTDASWDRIRDCPIRDVSNRVLKNRDSEGPSQETSWIKLMKGKTKYTIYIYSI